MENFKKIIITLLGEIFFYTTLLVYNILLLLCALPVIIGSFTRAVFFQKDNLRSIKNRFCLGIKKIKKNKDQKIYHIHAASLGETKMNMPLFHSILNNNDIVVLTTNSPRSVENFIKKHYRNIENFYHYYMPYELCILRFLQQIKPDFFILTESEIWPNMITFSRFFVKKMSFINARITIKKKKYNTMVKLFVRLLLSKFNKIFFDSNESMENGINFFNLDQNICTYISNFKNDNSKNIYLQNKNNNTTNSSKLLTLANTHQGEEELILSGIESVVSKNVNKNSIIICPRKIDRAFEISTIGRSFGYKIEKNFNIFCKNINTNEKQIFILDQLGSKRLYDIYKISDIVILGGAFFEGVGGHSPLEPLAFGCHVINGKHNTNSKSLINDLLNMNLITNVDSTKHAICNKIEKMSSSDSSSTQQKLIDNYFDIKKNPLMCNTVISYLRS